MRKRFQISKGFFCVKCHLFFGKKDLEKIILKIPHKVHVTIHRCKVCNTVTIPYKDLPIDVVQKKYQDMENPMQAFFEKKFGKEAITKRKKKQCKQCK